ncbi:hypothetical protein ACWC3X_40185 [Streptomyces populi]
MHWGERPRWARWASVVFVVGFVEGFSSHVRDVLVHGLHVYDGWPEPSRLLFFALFVLDPLVAVLLVFARPFGPLLGAAGMTADLTANYQGNWDGLLHDPLAYMGIVGLLPMTLFGLFVLATALPLHRAFRKIPRQTATV